MLHYATVTVEATERFPKWEPVRPFYAFSKPSQPLHFRITTSNDRSLTLVMLFRDFQSKTWGREMKSRKVSWWSVVCGLMLATVAAAQVPSHITIESGNGGS